MDIKIKTEILENMENILDKHNTTRIVILIGDNRYEWDGKKLTLAQGMFA